LFKPVLPSFGRISLLLQDSYEKVRNGDLIDAETGELRPSIDVVRRRSETQMRLAASLGLTPLSLWLFAKEKCVDLAGAFAEIGDAEKVNGQKNRKIVYCAGVATQSASLPTY
jgi:hypothetical protein